MSTIQIIQIILTAIFGSSVISIIVTKLLNKKRESAEVNNLVIGGAKITLEMSDVINRAIEAKTLERTKELRDVIAANDLKHYKESQAQGLVYAEGVIKNEEMYERKIQALYMKIDVLERNFNKQIEKMDQELLNEIAARDGCLKRLGELQELVREHLKNNDIVIKDIAMTADITVKNPTK